MNESKSKIADWALRLSGARNLAKASTVGKIDDLGLHDPGILELAYCVQLDKNVEAR